jgi:hypothetical protein
MTTTTNPLYFESALGTSVRVLAGEAKLLMRTRSACQARRLLQEIARVRTEFPPRPGSPLLKWLDQLERQVEELLSRPASLVS